MVKLIIKSPATFCHADLAILYSRERKNGEVPHKVCFYRILAFLDKMFNFPELANIRNILTYKDVVAQA